MASVISDTINDRVKVNLLAAILITSILTDQDTAAYLSGLQRVLLLLLLRLRIIMLMHTDLVNKTADPVSILWPEHVPDDADRFVA